MGGMGVAILLILVVVGIIAIRSLIAATRDYASSNYASAEHTPADLDPWADFKRSRALQRKWRAEDLKAWQAEFDALDISKHSASSSPRRLQ
jgi:hypothetical protein